MSRPREQGPSPAELFDSFIRPSIFEPWTRELLEYTDPAPDDRVLDLACATGTVARRLAPRLGRDGEVVGVDLSSEMLDVARERAAAEGVNVEWREGDATELDLPADTFDLVLCQQGIQFFDDPLSALRGVRRVLVDGGRLVLAVWQPLEGHPVYRALLEAEADHLDAPLADVARPFTFGDRDRLRGLLDEAGFDRSEIEERTLEVEFDDPGAFVALTVMAGAAIVPEVAEDEAAAREALIDAVRSRSRAVLSRYREGGRLRFPMPSYLAMAYA